MVQHMEGGATSSPNPSLGSLPEKVPRDLHQGEGVGKGVFHRMWPQLAFWPTTPGLRPWPASNTPHPSSLLLLCPFRLRASSPLLLLFWGPTEAVTLFCSHCLSVLQDACPRFTGHLPVSALWEHRGCLAVPLAPRPPVSTRTCLMPWRKGTGYLIGSHIGKKKKKNLGNGGGSTSVQAPASVLTGLGGHPVTVSMPDAAGSILNDV